MGLVGFVAISVIAYTAFGLTLGKAAGHIDPGMSTFVLNGIGAVLPLGYWAVLRFALHRDVLSTSGRGLGWSLGAGVAIGVFSIGLINVVAKGGVSYGLPMIYGGAIVLGAVGSHFLLHERISGLHLVGLAVTAFGVAIIAYAHR
jgi:drug/metabolite transporter (DMT)-like permease